jgi:hypothetical protein
MTKKQIDDSAKKCGAVALRNDLRVNIDETAGAAGNDR